MSPNWVIKVYVFLCFFTYISTRILREIWKKTFELAVGLCCCLQTCNSVENVLVMGLVLGPNLMAISVTGILLHAKVSPFYNVLQECIAVVYR